MREKCRLTNGVDYSDIQAQGVFGSDSHHGRYWTNVTHLANNGYILKHQELRVEL